MKALSILALLFLSTATALDFFQIQKAIANDEDDISVPGDNPLYYCEDPSKSPEHLLKIEKVDLDPNPPEPGKKLTIKATGNFTEEIEDGAYVWLTVKFGSIRLIHRQEDVCQQMKAVDKECPLEEGKTTITRDVDLPQQIPPGTFNVEADAYTKDERKITCLKASIDFRRKSEL